MIDAVLRHPDLIPPYVLSVGDDGVVPDSYRDAGWTIDLTTTPDEARAEIAEHADLVAAEAQDVEPPVPHFADDADAPTEAGAAVETAPQTAATPSPSGQAVRATTAAQPQSSTTPAAPQPSPSSN